MSHDYPVNGRSNSGVQELAKGLLTWLGIANRYPVNILHSLRQDFIWTVFGIKRLTFRVLPDEEMGKDDARTIVTPTAVAIEARRSVVSRAEMGVGRDRQTLAHELGHAVMHEGPPMARRQGATGNTTPFYIPAFRSAEHQAKVFAAAFLIIDSFAEALTTAEEISVQFGVSLESAQIYWKEREEIRNHEEIADRIQQKANDFRASVTAKPLGTNYLGQACPNCGKETLTPIGIKVSCTSCDYMGDLPDGDGISQ